MNFKMSRIFIVGVFILLCCEEYASTKTVLFYYDKTDVTGYDIAWLTTHVIELSTVCLKKGLDLKFELKFPDKSNTQKTSHFTASKSGYSIEGRSILKNLLTHIKESPSYSAIYVITNVTMPSDETSLDEILKAIQIKRTEVNFLIGKTCSYDDIKTDILKKYGVITWTSNGDVMGPDSLTSDLFADVVYHRFTSVLLVMSYNRVAHIDNMTICTDGGMFRRPENQNELQPNFYSTEYNNLAGNGGLGSSLIEWEMTVTSDTHTTEKCAEFHELYRKLNLTDYLSENQSYMIIGNWIKKYEFDFNYGFTVADVCSLNETFRRPINGMSNKIYVSPSHKNADYGFDYFSIFFRNHTEFGEKIALERIPETDLYVGSFYPPKNEYFYIKAVVQKKDKIIYRKSHTALSAAEGFGDNYDNPMFDKEPTLENQPAPEDNAFAYYIDEIFEESIGYIFVAFIGFCFGYVLCLQRESRKN